MIYLLIYKDLSNPYEHLRTFVGFDPYCIARLIYLGFRLHHSSLLLYIPLVLDES
jgi:hypothetical protein